VHNFKRFDMHAHVLRLVPDGVGFDSFRALAFQDGGRRPAPTGSE